MIYIKTDLPAIPACCEECPAIMTARDQPLPACTALADITHNYEIILRRAGAARPVSCPLVAIETKGGE